MDAGVVNNFSLRGNLSTFLSGGYHITSERPWCPPLVLAWSLQDAAKDSSVLFLISPVIGVSTISLGVFFPPSISVLWTHCMDFRSCYFNWAVKQQRIVCPPSLSRIWDCSKIRKISNPGGNGGSREGEQEDHKSMPSYSLIWSLTLIPTRFQKYRVIWVFSFRRIRIMESFSNWKVGIEVYQNILILMYSVNMAFNSDPCFHPLVSDSDKILTIQLLQLLIFHMLPKLFF